MKIAVLGAGVMGKRIALLFAERDFSVVLWSHVYSENLRKELKREARLWKLNYETVAGFIELTQDLSQIEECLLIVESVCEDALIKSEILRKVSAVVSSEACIVTNTSSLSIEALAASVTNPERFHGLHFFNPPQQLRFVEVSRCSKTSDDTIAFSEEILRRLEMSYIDIPDIPGFVVNYVLFSSIVSAILLKQTYGINAKDIDNAMKLGARHPMGPLELADFIGLDTSLIILKSLCSRTGDKRFEPPALLQTLVARHELGKKSGKGFYEYS